MGAPREVWVVVGDVSGRTHGMGDTEAEARNVSASFLPARTSVHRYVLARPKREAVAWVVRFDADGRRYACVDDVATTSISPRVVNWTRTNALQFAHRFVTRESAECYARAVGIHGARIVKLVRPVKP